jgi:hypothetical protein
MFRTSIHIDARREGEGSKKSFGVAQPRQTLFPAWFPLPREAGPAFAPEPFAFAFLPGLGGQRLRLLSRVVGGPVVLFVQNSIMYWQPS